MTGTFRPTKPNRAGSPGAGTRLNTGVLIVIPGALTGSLSVIDAAPIAVSAEQALMLLFSPAEMIVEKSRAEHWGRPLTFPIRPGGSFTFRSLSGAGTDGRI